MREGRVKDGTGFVAQGSSNTGLSFTKLEKITINWFGEHEGDRFK